MSSCEQCRWTGRTPHTCPRCGGMVVHANGVVIDAVTARPVPSPDPPAPFPIPDSDVRAAMLAANGSIKNAAKALGVERVALRDYLAATAGKPA